MDKQKLYESIMSSVSTEIKKALNEYRTKKEIETFEIDENDISRYLKISSTQWVINKIQNCSSVEKSMWATGFDRWGSPLSISFRFSAYGGKTGTGQINGSVNRYNAKYEVVEALGNVIAYMKQFPCFEITSNKIRSYQQFDFRYDMDKDAELHQAIEDAKNKFEADVTSTDTSEYAPTARDWEKMLGYMNGHSNPERVANSCKDHNKIVARYIIARVLGWKEAERAFKHKIVMEHILSDTELEAYSRKYAGSNIPEDLRNLLDDFKANDATGGIATNDENLKLIPDNAKRYLHNITSIESYTIEPLDELVTVMHYGRPTRANGWHSHSWEASYKCKLAKITFNMVDAPAKEYFYVYYQYSKNNPHGVAIYSKKPTSISAETYKLAGPTTVLHELKRIFEED